MNCSKCGAENKPDAQECGKCGWSLRSRLAVEEQPCVSHPWRRAVTTCTACGTDICEECEVFVGGVIYCRECAERPSEAELLRDILVIDPADAEPASLGTRVIAAAIDWVIIACGFLVLWVAFWLLTADPAVPFAGSEHPAAHVLFWLVIAVGLSAYFILSIATGAQTPGMSTVDIAVILESGQAVDLRTAALRFLAVFPTAISVWGVISAASDPYGRMLHDRLTGTRVVKMGG